MRLTFRRGRAQARECLERRLAWEPERIIASHGKWYEKHAVNELKRAFRWLL